MSLELAIQANTAAIHQLIAVMSAGKFMSAERVSGEVGPSAEEGAEKKAAQERISELETQKYQEVKAELLKMQAASQAASQPAEEAKSDEANDFTASAIDPLNYEADVLPVLHKFLVAKGGRVAGEPLLKKYGVDKFSKVPVEQLGSLLADLNEAMGA